MWFFQVVLFVQFVCKHSFTYFSFFLSLSFPFIISLFYTLFLTFVFNTLFHFKPFLSFPFFSLSFSLFSFYTMFYLYRSLFSYLFSDCKLIVVGGVNGTSPHTLCIFVLTRIYKAVVGNTFGFAGHIRDKLGIRGPVHIHISKY